MLSSYACNLAFDSLLRFLGTWILTSAYWSPRTEGSFIDTMPFPLRRIFVPDCVPSLIRHITSPYKVCTTASPPNTAVVNGIFNIVYTSCPFLSKPVLGITWIFKIRSPGWPPPVPGCPFPRSRMLFPVSIPAGIFTCNVCVFPIPLASDNEIRFSQPKAASSKLTVTSAFRSAPSRLPPKPPKPPLPVPNP